MNDKQKSVINGIVDKVLSRLCLYFVAFLIIEITLNMALSFFRVGFDSTDGAERSGMAIKRDAMTGCQYLTTTKGGMTPRLDENGNHICIGGL